MKCPNCGYTNDYNLKTETEADLPHGDFWKSPLNLERHKDGFRFSTTCAGCPNPECRTVFVGISR